jgi:hypothetical protein
MNSFTGHVEQASFISNTVIIYLRLANGERVKVETHVEKVAGQELNPGSQINGYWPVNKCSIMLNENKG